MNRSEKAKLLQSLSTGAVAIPATTKRETAKTFEIDGQKVPYEAERFVLNEARAQVNRDLLRQARARAERNED